MLATYMRRMRHNKLEIRIAGSSCRPQKKKKKIQNVLEFVNLSGTPVGSVAAGDSGAYSKDIINN